jgi:hypothetical protein
MGILEPIFEFLLEVIFQVICAGTGEVIFWIVTLGRRRPFEIENHSNLSTLIGALFWALIAIVVAMVFIL